MPDPVTHPSSRGDGAPRAPRIRARRRRTRLGAGLLGVLLGSVVSSPPAKAQEPPPDERPRVAVLLLATGGLDPATADGLTEVLIGAVAARGGVRIVGKEEFQAQLGQGEDGTLACISAMPCLGRVGVELGVREVIAGTLTRRDDTWVFNLDRVEVASGAAQGHVFREVQGDVGAVADALAEAVPALYAPPPGPGVAEPELPAPPADGTLVLSVPPGAEVAIDGEVVGVGEGAPLRREGLAPGPHDVRVTAPERLPWARTVSLAPGAELHLEPRLDPAVQVREAVHPVVWIGAGAAAAALGAAIALGVASQDTLRPSLADRREGNVTRADLLAFYAAREREAIAADVLFGVAGAAALAAVVALFFPERETVPVDAVDVSIGPGGIAIGGRL